MDRAAYQQLYELERTHWWFQGMYALCRDELTRRVPSNGSRAPRVIVDVGCGTGHWAEGFDEEAHLTVATPQVAGGR